MHLYAGGCSLTWGKELLPYPSQEIRRSPELTQRRLKIAWPGLVQEKVGFKSHYNDGRTSGSNTLIARRLMNYITNYSDQQNLYVVVAWSGIQRWEVRYEDRPKAFFTNKGDVPMAWAQRNLDVKRYWQSMGIAGMLNKKVLWERFLITVLGVQSFLHNRAIPYHMLHAISPTEEYTTIDSPLLRYVDQDRFPDILTPRSGFNDIIADHYGTTDGYIAVGGHPTTYDFISDRIVEEVANDLPVS